MTVYVNASNRHSVHRAIGRCVELTKTGCIKVKFANGNTKTFLADGQERGTRGSWSGARIVAKEDYDNLGERARSDAARRSYYNAFKELEAIQGTPANREALLSAVAKLTASIHSL